MTTMNLKEAAESLDIPKRRLWRAVKAGNLEATRQRRGSQWEYVVTEEALEAYRAACLESLNETGGADGTAPAQFHGAGGVESFDTHGAAGVERYGTGGSGGAPGFHAPTAEQILDRLEASNRRAAILELQLQQTQRLLCERNDDQHEREARAREAEEKAMQAQEQANALAIELESLKTEMSAREARWAEERQASKPWWKRMFG